MTKKPHKLKHVPVPGLGLLGVPGLRHATEQAAAREMDAMRATLWAQQIGLNLQKLRTMTLDEIARHISRNTAWGALEVPSYVMATLAVEAAHRATAKQSPPFSKGRVDPTKRCDMCGAPWEYVDEPPRPVVYHAEDCPHAGSSGRNRTQAERLDPDKYEVANGPDGPMIFETDHIPPLPDELTKIRPNRYAGIRYQDGKRVQ